MAHPLGGEGFDDFTDGDIAELMADKELGEDDLVNLVFESEFDKSDEEEFVPVTFTAKVIREGLALGRKLGDHFMQNDTNVERALRFQRDINRCLAQYEEVYKDLTKNSKQFDANTLRTSALALVFSTAEYCAPVWEGSCHTKLIDTQLNSTLRIITGVCQPTRIDWLSVLAHISPPEIRRKEATKKMYQKLLDSPDLEINPILQSPPNHRLKSRKPIWSRGNQLLSQNFNISEAWTNSWISTDIPNKNLITSPNVKIPGFSLPRREWVLLNRFRTGQGRCAELMKLWGYTKDPNCT
ncbi:hypothetical protein LAZ67_2002670 [Cordylochernes scorpioides]|uniref:Uncharacterized protein n=1 Tax=Cordylochernes scorpioides TaxID=51811 RepID=A0ABY6K524_9ARAC|nr:hypothetical protein LAZ67_2002670 [Cordylochernes scorpioides]